MPEGDKLANPKGLTERAKRAHHALGSPFGRAGAKRLRGFVPPQGASAGNMPFAVTALPVKK